MYGYIEDTFEAIMSKKALAEDKAKEIAGDFGYEVEPDGIIGKHPDGTDNPDAQKTTSLFEPTEAADGSGRWFVLSIRGIFKTTYAEIESYAGLTLVEIPSTFFPPIPDEGV